MSKTFTVVFKDIPEEVKFSIFDEHSKERRTDGYSRSAPAGDSEHSFEIPDEWVNPHIAVSSYLYYLPNSWRPIGSSEKEVKYTGGDFYIDVTREPTPNELNLDSIEKLTHQQLNVTGRQKFYIQLLALQSYHEYLVYMMLVVSGYITKSKFKSLATAEKRNKKAFSKLNEAFFAEEITLCPGKKVELRTIDEDWIDKQLDIFELVRKLRNKVAHKWPLTDTSRESLVRDFSKVDENLVNTGDDDSFYEAASFVLVRLYAKSFNTIGNTCSVLREKATIDQDRSDRGY